MKYKGYFISDRYKLKYHTNKLSGHTWSEHIPLKGYRLFGPFMLHGHNMDCFRSIKKAKEYIDFRVKFGLNKLKYPLSN